MQFESNNIYHIYNRGNNSQQVFFSPENYMFFLQKVKTYIRPHADILAWCLMPNHFHLMIYVNDFEIDVIEKKPECHQKSKKRNLNDSISILLRSYTRAIQVQEKRTGSLFQHRTKSVCLTESTGVSPAWGESNSGSIIFIYDAEKEYPQICFDYIHRNPVNAGLVKKPEDWQYSSFQDYCGIRNGDIIHRDRAREFGLNW